MILLGAGIGVLGSTINPFATGIASDFAGVGLDEGLGAPARPPRRRPRHRASAFVLRYAERVRQGPDEVASSTR